MKRLLPILIALIILCGCDVSMLNQFSDDGGVQVPADKGVVKITLPGSQNRAATQADVESYVVALTGVDVPYNNGMTGLPGETLRFENLVPGDYTVNVNAYDAPDPELPESSMIFTGSTNVTVLAGQVTTATVQLQYVNGDLDVEIVFPDQPGDGTPDPDSTEQLDQAQTEILNISAESYYESGQVFTAGMTGELSKVELCLWFDPAMTGFNPQVYVIVRDGAGLYGPELGRSNSVLLQTGEPGWYSFNMSDVVVNTDSQYTIDIHSDYPIQISGHDNSDGGDVYAGGYAIWYGSQQSWDYVFRTYVRQ
jgi:hypothetical protein